MDDDGEVARISTAAQFKALGHPMRHRLLLALGQGQATISQLAAALGSNKGNIAHHLKVLDGRGPGQPGRNPSGPRWHRALLPAQRPPPGV